MSDPEWKDDTDKILNLPISDAEKIANLSWLCRHRAKLVDLDAELRQKYIILLANDECVIENLKKQIEILEGIPIWTRLIICLNNWAKP